VCLKIPDGYEVEYLPATTRYDGPLLGYEISYKAEPAQIVYSKKFFLNYLLMKPEQFSSWNEAIKNISEAYKESIILKKK
jgi:hypothetical protein